MRTNRGAIWVSVIALFLGFAAVTQVRSQDVFSRSLNLETPASLTTLIANLSERNNAIKEEILDLRHRTDTAREAIASGKGSLTEAEHQLGQHRWRSHRSIGRHIARCDRHHHESSLAGDAAVHDHRRSGTLPLHRSAARHVSTPVRDPGF